MPSKQIYFEDVEAGYEVPTLEKDPTSQQLVKYAGASGDFYQIHYDKDFALKNKLPGTILHGALKNAFLGQLMTDFAGELDGCASCPSNIAGWICPEPRSYAKAKSSRNTSVTATIWWIAKFGRKRQG